MRISDWSSDVCSSDLVQQPAALADHLQEALPGMMVLAVGLEVLGEVLDALGEEGDLDLGGAGVHVVGSVALDQVGLAFPGQGDRKSVVSGESVTVRVDLGGGRIIKKKKKYKQT